MPEKYNKKKHNDGVCTKCEVMYYWEKPEDYCPECGHELEPTPRGFKGKRINQKPIKRARCPMTRG